jgi:hypothetical protein
MSVTKKALNKRGPLRWSTRSRRLPCRAVDCWCRQIPAIRRVASSQQVGAERSGFYRT